MKLKKWVCDLLSGIIISYIFFIALTIDNVLDNATYDKILIVWTILAIGSVYLLEKYSNYFEN